MITETIKKSKEIKESQTSPNRLDNLYTYIITNRKHERYDWHFEYKWLTSQIEVIRQNLNQGKSFADNSHHHEIFRNTSWENDEQAFENFMSKLITEDSNGISSNGQSIVSKHNFTNEAGLFLNDPIFVSAVEEVIKNPNYDAFHNLISAWKEQKDKGDNVKMNHLLINRIVAASTLDVSSTVNEDKFDVVYKYLKENGLISKSGDETDWYEKNIHVIKELKNGLSHYKDGISKKDDDVWLSIFVWELYVYLSKPFVLQKQVIRYGAPGTGKTYTARQDSRLQFDIWQAEFNPKYAGNKEDHIETVQFHPSFGYEDFIEGLRPVPTDNGTELKLVNGVFKEFCRKASKWEADVVKMLNGKDFEWRIYTIEDFLKDLEDQSIELKEDWKFLTEIIEPSKKLLANALPPYFFIIDEINRAELSRVLGELMFSLENRGVKGAIKTQYSHLNQDSDSLIKSGNNHLFFVPVNVYVIGTMNTIDRSVESFDFALRRRFYWERRNPDYMVLRYHYHQLGLHGWEEMVDNLQELNKRIKDHDLLSEDHQIGHAYLMNLPFRNDISKPELKRQVWQSRIAPLLDEYLRGTGSDSSQFKSSFNV
ncbi:McrB family protein [Gramella sp. KN1008]|uniref:McrB family protein n=1 Tax=Gramella sp. KN1008 TaxID=2529298 RepID=UPI00103B90AF|nr:AAA family ATPase [Gramella sp. KN1008]TBW30249.1 restriction endonuclease [Gramella sp. KN1008]